MGDREGGVEVAVAVAVGVVAGVVVAALAAVGEGEEVGIAAVTGMVVEIGLITEVGVEAVDSPADAPRPGLELGLRAGVGVVSMVVSGKRYWLKNACLEKFSWIGTERSSSANMFP